MQRETRWDNTTFAASASLSKNVSIGGHRSGSLWVPANWDGGDILFNVAPAPDTLGGNSVATLAQPTGAADAPLVAGTFSRLRERKADGTYQYARIASPTPGEWHEIPDAVFKNAWVKLESVDPDTDGAMTVGGIRTFVLAMKS